MRLNRTPGQCEFQTCKQRLAQVVCFFSTDVDVCRHLFA
jgi:hypothetical protein